MPAGRFAPSPSGDLYLGNLRTALLAWLFARSTERRFVMRVEDLDRVKGRCSAIALTTSDLIAAWARRCSSARSGSNEMAVGRTSSVKTHLPTPDGAA